MTTLRQHAGKAKWVQATLVALPVGLHLANPKVPLLNPPLGPLGDLVIPLALVILGIAGFLPWLFATKSKASVAAWISGVLCFISLFSFAMYIQQSVVRLDIPSRGTFILVSVGDQRSDFAKKNMPDATDAEMLHRRGYSEQDIEFLWTKASIVHSRLEVLFSYIMTLALLNFFIGAITKADGASGPKRGHIGNRMK